MATHQYKGAGLKSVGSYQVAGFPWITGSSNLDRGKVHMLEFPFVIKSFTVINTNASANHHIRVHFNSGTLQAVGAVTQPGEAGAKAIVDSTSPVILGKHFISIPGASGSMTFNVKCKKAYISASDTTNAAADSSYQVFAELTTIGTSSMPHLTGSGIDTLPGETDPYGA
tara:strand:+ start:36 stop:545 length:510 start_codon:yes stop_codon:yes gene_type:complete